MSKRKRKTRSAVASFIRNVKSEIGNLEYKTQDLPLLYPVTPNQPLKVISRYPILTEDQQDLLHYSRNFYSKALKSPFYLLFRKTDTDYLPDQSENCANEFIKNLVKQRPLSFPEELKKKVKFSKEKNNEGLYINSGSDSEEKSEEKEISESQESEVPGIWEDGKESDNNDSEDII